MIIILTPYRSERLDYICHFIFCEQLGTNYQIIADPEETLTPNNNTEKLILRYGYSQNIAGSYSIPSTGLLFQKGIRAQNISVTNHSFKTEKQKSCKIFFEEEGHSFPFDIFSAIFYLISRYEEYLPHEKDEFGRFPHEASLAFQNQFLHQPLVNIWLQVFKESLLTHWNHIQFQTPKFHPVVTYDVDMAWSYKKKGIIRNLFGFIRNPTRERLQVLTKIKKDPFDTFDFIQETTREWKLDSIYFFLLAEKRSRFDKNINPKKKEFTTCIQNISNHDTIGIHPSFQSASQHQLIATEKKILADLTKKDIIDSRQHYLRFNLPDTYRALISCGIEKEYSMGYGTINGFRASFAGSFKWFDLQNEKTTRLRIYPFSYMDANSIFEEKITPEEAEKIFLEQLQICKETNGLFISIFHNHLLTENNAWRYSFERIIPQIQ